MTNDEYEIPLAVAESTAELARMVGVKPESIYTIMSRSRKGKQHSPYMVVTVDDND